MNSEQIAAEILQQVPRGAVISESGLEILKATILQALQEREQAIRAEYRALAAEWRARGEIIESGATGYKTDFAICASEIEGIK